MVSKFKTQASQLFWWGWFEKPIYVVWCMQVDYVIDFVIDLRWYLTSKPRYYSFFGRGSLKSVSMPCNQCTMRHSWPEIMSLTLFLIWDDIRLGNSSVRAFLVGAVWKRLCHATNAQWDIHDGRLCHWLDFFINQRWYRNSKLRCHSFFGGGGLKSHSMLCDTCTMRHSWWEIMSLTLLLIWDGIGIHNLQVIGMCWLMKQPSLNDHFTCPFRSFITNRRK